MLLKHATTPSSHFQATHVSEVLKHWIQDCIRRCIVELIDIVIAIDHGKGHSRGTAYWSLEG
jgi:hypothetical protein